MVIQHRVSTTHNVFPNLTVYERYYATDPTKVIGYKVTANAGYVFKDTSEINYEYNAETDENEQVTYYYRVAYLVRSFNFANLPFVAVMESGIPTDYIK